MKDDYNNNEKKREKKSSDKIQLSSFQFSIIPSFFTSKNI
jgi:hypothetical protein